MHSPDPLTLNRSGSGLISRSSDILPLSLYLHLPFCKKKCNYCDFVSYAGKEELIEEYVEALVKEINSPPSSPSLNPSTSLGTSKRGGNRAERGGGELKSIYFGGGTPTLLEAEHYKKVLAELKMNFNFILAKTEISTEANPATADLEKLKALRKLGINRLSIGTQSFNDQHLKTLGRIHNSKDIYQIYNDARSAGFENINLDLIFALPNQTLEEWKSDLQAAIDLGPEHLSTYNLQIEEGTLLWKILREPATEPASPARQGGRRGSQETETFSLRFPGSLQIPNEETELEMYEYTIETLTAAGYHHYEISNFAKPGFECRHNINYWKNENYLGFGAGAHSHINGKRWANPDSIEEYFESRSQFRVKAASIEAGQRTTMPDNDTGFAVPAGRQVTDQRETIFMGLRLLDGLEIDKFNGFEKEISELQEDGLLMRENNHYKLTRKGLYLGNLVFEKFV